MPSLPGPRGARLWYFVMAAFCVVVLVGAALTSCSSAWNASESATPSPTESPTASPTTASTVRSPVYFLGSDANHDKLYREFRETPDLGDPVASAVSAMTRMKPLDDDYQNFWRPADSVTSSVQDNTITVDVSSDAFEADPSKRQAKQSIQQLVYTATAAAAQAELADGIVAVTILVDGEPNYSAWDAVKLGRPISRDNSARSPVWLIDPQEGQTFHTGALTIKGNGASTSGSLIWQVTDSKNKVIRREPIPVSTDPASPTTFSFVLELPDGNYTVTAYEVGKADSSKHPKPLSVARYIDQKRFTMHKTHATKKSGKGSNG